MKYTEQRKTVKSAKEKWQVTDKGKCIRTVADFSTQTLNARKAWNDIFQTQK
jgi:ribosomal protein L35